ncbi:MAG: sigma-70 family RNA polymerase sigma factor [Planctomycetes bacterium]|nr:sigma-70 family RNA polymerase sigma factor [Planctomycetota bacterium]
MTQQALKARFEAVALQHLDTVYRVARALVRDASEAEDLVQEAFVRAFKGFGGFELREYGAKPWLLRILHNVFYTHKNKQRREPTLLDDVDFDHFEDEFADAEVEPTLAETINWDRVDEELKAAVDELQPEYRTTLLLWSVEGLSYKEIADACDCALGTVMSRLYRARQLVGRKLRKYAEERRLDTGRFGS